MTAAKKTAKKTTAKKTATKKTKRSSSSSTSPAGTSYTGYCVKCRAKRQFKGSVKTAGGRRMATGTCPKCGTKISRILGKA